MRAPAVALLLCLLPLAGGARAQSADAGTVTVYRCTDAGGHQALRDTPCPAGQKQQAREMVRPKDAPPKPVAPPAPAPTPAPRPETRTVYLVPPMPLYECTTPDGARYTSEDGDGNPRWMPLWALDYPVLRPRVPPRAGISSPTPRKLPTHRPPPRDINWPVATGGGAWVRDACVLLPPSETCARLRDRRDAIRTRFFNAQEKERDALRIEERGIIARLDNDCGSH